MKIITIAILVININNYIGASTKIEIEYAKKLGKEIIYYTQPIVDMKNTPLND